MPLLNPPAGDSPAPYVPPAAPEPGLAGVGVAWDALGHFIHDGMPAVFGALNLHAYVAGRIG